MADPKILSSDAGDLYDRIYEVLTDGNGEPLYPGDERRIFGESQLAVLVPVYNSVEDAAMQTMLRYARGEVLDELGVRVGVQRLGGTRATTVLQFTASKARDEPIVIPKWSTATADDQVYFATDEDAIIPAGETTVKVNATCTAAGDIGNGYPIGSIATIVRLIPYVSEVTNLEETHGGDDGELYTEEGDNRLRERIRLKPEAFSVAGPELAYVYWAKTADPSIIDVTAISETEEFEREVEVFHERVYIGGDQLLPERGITVDGSSEGFDYEYEDQLLTITLTGEDVKQKPKVKVRLWHTMDGRVRIVPLMEGGALPTEDTIQRIKDTIEPVRPMTDVVSVESPVAKEYGISLSYWTTPDAEGAVVSAIEGDGGAIDAYNLEQSTVLGRDINPDKLKERLLEAGAIRVDITEPVYTAVADGEVAQFNGSKTVTHQVESLARWDV